MSNDHLWPARAEYLRRGTPVYWQDPSSGDVCSGEMSGSDEPNGYLLDLRDVTARAHAAWAWTQRLDDRRGLIEPLQAGLERVNGHGHGYEVVWARRCAHTLLRMACGDESVTVAEAREALGWAEGVGDEQ